MEKASVGAATLHEDVSWKKTSKTLESSQVHLIFASLEYLLRNPHLKRFYTDERFRDRIFCVLIDEAHVIKGWAETFRKDFGELGTLRVILGNNVPC
jgi:superfamily II DNA helicase RecQ